MVRVACIALFFALAGLGWAQVSNEPAPAAASEPADRRVTMADRAADDGLQKLLDTVAGLPAIRDDVTQSVASLFASTPDAELELRKLVAGAVQVGGSRQQKRGITSVEVSIATERLNDLVREALAKHPGPHGAKQVSIAPAAGPAIVVTGQACDDDLARDNRPGWRHCTAQDISMSVKAAQIDLRQQLLAWLNRVPLTGKQTQTLGQLGRLQPQVAAVLADRVKPIAGENPVFDSSGTCIITAVIRPELLANFVGAAIREAGSAAEGVKPQGAFEAITVRGFSVASPRVISNRAAVAGGPKPEWAGKTISKLATAAGATNQPDVAARNALAIKAARVEAQRQLWLEFEQLVLPSGRTVAETIAAQPDRDTVIQEISNAVFEMSKPSVDSNGVATVTLAISLESVWEAVGR